MTKPTNTLIRRLEKQLPKHGHLAKPIGTETLVVRLPVASPTCSHLRGATTAVIHPDQNGTGLVVECCWAMDTTGADSPGAILMRHAETAFQTSLVQIQHDPRDGEVRLRVDCLTNDSEAVVRHVVRSLKSLADFLALAGTTSAAEHSMPPDSAATPAAANDTSARLEALARKPGGINRLEKLFQLNQSRRPPAPPSSN